MENAANITVQVNVTADSAKAWDYWTKPRHITNWNFASNDWHCPYAENDLRAGGKLKSRMEARDGSAGFDFAGTYTRVEPHALIEYTFGDRVGLVEFVAVPQGITVRVTFDAETEHPADMQRQGWQAILDNFVRYVEGHR